MVDESKIQKVLLPVSVAKSQQREKSVRSEFWPKLKSFAAQIPFSEELVSAYYCAADTRTPPRVRGTLLAALAYFILPMDLVPDILAAVGFTDDLAVLTAAMTIVQGHVTGEHREKAHAALTNEEKLDP